MANEPDMLHGDLEVTDGPSPADLAPAKTFTTQVEVRVHAYCRDMAGRAGTPMTPAVWSKQGLSAKDVADRPPALAFRYHGSNAVRAVFDRKLRVTEGRKLREMDGVWLRTGVVTVDATSPAREITLDPPRPLVLGLAKAANADVSKTLHITDREDVAIAIGASGGAVIGVAAGSSMFANEEAVDAHTPDLPRPLHPACAHIPLEGRDLVFIFEDRTVAVNIARGLRQGDAHTGSVALRTTSDFLSEIDSAISRGFQLDELFNYTLLAALHDCDDLLTTVLTGTPGSIGMRVPMHLLSCLPAEVRDLIWPVPEGGGTSWDNLDWGLTRAGAVNGLFRDQKGDEFTLNKPALALVTPIYITRRFVMQSETGEEHVELCWAEPRDGVYTPQSRVIPSQFVFGNSTARLLREGVPVADAKRASQWFNAFRVSNPHIPVTNLYDQAGWIQTAQGPHFLLPSSNVEGHVLQEDVLTGVVCEGDRNTHWNLVRDFYQACDPINQLLLVAPHASLLLAALNLQGCVFGLVDESSRGKTVLLQTSARQYGWDGGDYAFDASNPPTAAYLERVVYRSNGLCIFIDEFHKFPNTSRDARGNAYTRQEAAYFLSNGQRRGRSNANGGIDASPKRVHCYSIVAGEKKHITALDRASQMDGAKVRMITVPLCDYAPTFLEKYGDLAGFMRQCKQLKGYVGLDVSTALAQILKTKGHQALRDALQKVTAQLNALFIKLGATTAASQRRATFLAPILYTEQLLAEHFPDNGMWTANFEDTCVVRTLRGEYGDRLMCIEDGASSVDIDDLSVSEILLEALRRDPTLIQGLHALDRPNPHPLAALRLSTRNPYPGLRLYPKAVMQLLRRNHIPDSAARDMLAKSGDFVLQPHGKSPPTLLHRSNGEQWLVPVAGWGWDILAASPGDAEGAAKDPLYEARKAFEDRYTKCAQGNPQGGAQEALHAAIDEELATIRATKAPLDGTLPSQLGKGYEAAWHALIDPLAERLGDKPQCQIDTDTWVSHVQKATQQ